MPTVKRRPHYRMSVVLVVDLPAVVELNKSQSTERMPGARIHDFLTSFGGLMSRTDSPC